MNIRIVDVPPGEAPESIRKKWVGCVLPVAEGEMGPRSTFTWKALTGPETLLGSLWFLLNGRYSREYGYIVDAPRALKVLAGKAPEVADWWKENTTCWQPGRKMLFHAEVCQEFDGTVDVIEKQVGEDGSQPWTECLTPDYLQPVNGMVRWLAVVALAVTIFLLAALELFLAAIPFFAPGFKPEDTPLLLGIIALFGLFLVTCSWILIRMVHQTRASNGMTILPLWFIRLFGLLFCMGGVIAVWQGNPLMAIKVGAIGVAMLFVGRMVRKSRLQNDKG